MKPLNILLVEDNDDDADLTIMAFREAKVENQVVRVGVLSAASTTSERRPSFGGRSFPVRERPPSRKNSRPIPSFNRRRT